MVGRSQALIRLLRPLWGLDLVTAWRKPGHGGIVAL